MYRWAGIDDGDLSTFAIRKLFFTASSIFDESNSVEDTIYLDRALAMITRRLALPFHLGIDGDAEKSRLSLWKAKEGQSRQVQSHMRQLLYVSKDREYRWSETTSEPILSMAAFQAYVQNWTMLGYRAKKICMVRQHLSVLLHFQRYSGQNAGERGEIAAQALILGAADEAKIRCKLFLQEQLDQQRLYEKLNADVASTVKSLDHVITVESFFQSLLSDDALSRLHINVNKEEKEFLTEMADYQMYLTHFVQTYTQYHFKDVNKLKSVAMRGAGLATPPLHPATDLIIPIFKGGNLEQATLLQFQIKNRARKFYQRSTLFEMMESQQINKSLPMVSVLIDFCRTSDSVATSARLEKLEIRHSARVLSSETDDQRSEPMGSLYRAGRDWRLTLTGCRKETYRVLDVDEDQDFLSQFLNVGEASIARAKETYVQDQCPLLFDPNEFAECDIELY